MLEDIVIPIAGCLTAIVIVCVVQLSRYKLKVEQIRADAMVRAEEVKAKNQLDLQRLIMQEHKQQEYRQPENSSRVFESDDSRVVREKNKL